MRLNHGVPGLIAGDHRSFSSGGPFRATARIHAAALVACLLAVSCTSEKLPQVDTQDVATVATTESADPALQVALLRFLGDQDGGVSAVVERDGTVEVATVGAADLRGQPITAETDFYVGSISKMITATLVMRLVDAGLIGLDDLLGTHLPDVPVGADRTIRALLGHRSGIPNYTERSDSDRAVRTNRNRSWEPLEILEYVDEPGTDVDPGVFVFEHELRVAGHARRAAPRNGAQQRPSG